MNALVGQEAKAVDFHVNPPGVRIARKSTGWKDWPQQAQILVLIKFLHTKIRMGTAGHHKPQGVNQ